MTIDEKSGEAFLQKIYKHLERLVRTAVREEAKLLTLNSQKVNLTNSEYISAEQAAAFLKRKLPTIYKDVRLGKIPYFRSGPRKLLFSKAELEDYIKRKKISSKQDIEDEVTNYILSSKEKRKIR